MQKNCPKCRMETGRDAAWCWHCGYSFEEAETDTSLRPSRPAVADDDGSSERND